MNFLLLIRRIEQFYFHYLILMFKLQMSYKTNLYDLVNMFFGKFRNFPKKNILCLYEKCTPDKLQMIENRQNRQKMLKSTKLTFCYSKEVKENSEKIQGHSWDCY